MIVVPKKNLKAYEAMSKQAPDDMPFDMKRMTYGGFTVFVDF